MRIILHIGAGKCGSSAIQEHFSHHPVLELAKSKVFNYGALEANGTITTGPTLRKKAEVSPFDYISSINLKSLDLKQDEILRNLTASLKQISKRCELLLLSNEGWHQESELFAWFNEAFAAYPVDVVFVVRPPVFWLNSAWWQWGAWTGASVERWIHQNIKNVCWSHFAKAWSALECVQTFEVVPLRGNILSYFYQKIGLPNEPATLSNKSLPDSILRVYQHRPELRPSPHESKLDFSLARHLPCQGKPDWVIPRPTIWKIISSTHTSNQELLEYMSSEDAAFVNEDSRWWGRGFYADFTHAPSEAQQVPQEDLYQLLADAYKAIQKLDLDNKTLRAKLENRRFQ